MPVTLVAAPDPEEPSRPFVLLPSYRLVRTCVTLPKASEPARFAEIADSFPEIDEAA